MYDFNKEYNSINDELTIITAQCKKVTNIKIIVFLMEVFLFFYNQKKQILPSWLLLIVLIVCFVILWLYHESLFRKKDYIETKLEIITRYQLRNEGKWASFENTGEEFLSEDSYVERDLDLFGEQSLYQYLCVANTAEGKKKLAEYLTTWNPEYEQIKEREEAVKDLINRNDFRLKVETLGALGKKKNKNNKDEWYYDFIEYLQKDRRQKANKFYVCGVILPILSLILFVMVYMHRLSEWCLIGSLIVQMVLSYYVSYLNRDVIQKLLRFSLSLDDIIDIARTIAEESFEASLLQKLQNEINSEDALIMGVKQLSKITDRISVRNNVYLHVFLQLFFMYDVHCIRQLFSWKKEYGGYISKIYKVIGEIEAILSLSSIALNREVCFPEILESGKPVFCTEELYHPLIDRKKVVANTINVSESVNIITGSNMSGKSTFMRTMGINMVLAYAGAPVCAKSMQLSIMRVSTCMRITDDVFLGRSSFYAEVLRLKTIVDQSKDNIPMFILIDEIFKGTNSIDRITGAKEVIRRLNKKHILLFISTHDLEICSLIDEHEVQGMNYHFVERYENNELCFDYKIRDGKCQSRNAKYILKMAGLID